MSEGEGGDKGIISFETFENKLRAKQRAPKSQSKVVDDPPLDVNAAKEFRKSYPYGDLSLAGVPSNIVKAIAKGLPGESTNKKLSIPDMFFAPDNLVLIPERGRYLLQLERKGELLPVARESIGNTFNRQIYESLDIAERERLGLLSGELNQSALGTLIQRMHMGVTSGDLSIGQTQIGNTFKLTNDEIARANPNFTPGSGVAWVVGVRNDQIQVLQQALTSYRRYIVGKLSSPAR